jgi:hypothetical protein
MVVLYARVLVALVVEPGLSGRQISVGDGGGIKVGIRGLGDCHLRL